MKIDFTNTEFRTNVFGILFAVVVLAALLSLSGCSSGIQQNTASNQTSFSGDKSFSFKNEGSNWRVDFEDDEISTLYKDGNRIPENEIEQHKQMIYEKLNGLKSDFKDLNGNVHRFHFDMDKLDEQMKKFKYDFDNDKFMHFKLEFDEEEFEKNMEKLEESLKDLKDKKIELYFDSEDFKENMKELEENLKDLPVPPIPPDVDLDVYMDMDQFKEGMKNFRESFKHFDFKFDSSEFDMSELRESMKDLKKNMKGLKIEMHGLKGEMKKLNSFLDELKSELVKDSYINSVEDEFKLEMDKNNTKVNDGYVTPQNHEQYKKLYKRHFDKEIDRTIKINRD
jgi:chromosome segregation ATPase